MSNSFYPRKKDFYNPRRRWFLDGVSIFLEFPKINSKFYKLIKKLIKKKEFSLSM